MRVLDLFCGRFGWGKAFAARGHEVTGVDLVEPPEIPEGCHFIKADILTIELCEIRQMGYDFICASSPCEQFSIHGMKHFHPNPKYPEMGLKLFNHTRALCEASGLPYVMENVRAAQQFVGNAVNHCGPFYLWGNAVPLLVHQGIRKGMDTGGVLNAAGASREEIRIHLRKNNCTGAFNSKSKERKEITAKNAEIPSELANSVVDLAEYLMMQKEKTA